MYKAKYFMIALALLAVWGTIGGPGVSFAAPSRGSAIHGSDHQPSWSKIQAAARKEGTLTIYGEVSPTLRNSLTEIFRTKFGVNLEFVGGKSAELATRWERENTAGVNHADIFHMGGITGTIIMKPKGAFGSIEPYLMLPEVLDPKAWPDGAIRYMDNDKSIMPLNNTWTSYVVVNTDLVKEGQLKSNKDIFNPEWKDKIMLYDPTIPGAATGWVWLMMANFGPEGGREYMKRVAALNPPVTRDVRQHVEWVAKGKYAIGIGAQSALVGEFKRRGAPVTLNHFTEAGHMMPGSGIVEVAAKPAHPNAATLYLNWLLTVEGQLTFNKPTGSPPLRKGVSWEGFDPINVARPTDKVFVTDESYYRQQEEVLQTAREIFGALRK